MDKSWILFLSFTALLPVSTSSGDGGVLLCYWPAKAFEIYPTFVSLEVLIPELCTHLVVSSYDLLDPDTSKYLSSNISLLQKENPKLKILLGLNTGMLKYENETFYRSLAKLSRLYNLDGMDVNWNFFNRWDNEEKTLVENLELLKSCQEDSNSQLILTLQGPIESIHHLNNLKRIAEEVDFISLAALSFGVHENTSVVAPLKSNKDKGNVVYLVDYIINQSVPREKILLGFPTFGRKVTNGIGGHIGLIDIVLYREICLEIKNNPSYEEGWNSLYSLPYVVINGTTITYENLRSYKEKLEFLKSRKLRGAAILLLLGDDYKGDCSDVKFPLVTEIKDFLATYATSSQSQSL